MTENTNPWARPGSPTGDQDKAQGEGASAPNDNKLDGPEMIRKQTLAANITLGIPIALGIFMAPMLGTVSIMVLGIISIIVERTAYKKRGNKFLVWAAMINVVLFFLFTLSGVLLSTFRTVNV